MPLPLAAVVWTGVRWAVKKGIKKGAKAIKKRMATRAKMQSKSKPATQKAKAQQAMKKHQAKKDEKVRAGAHGVKMRREDINRWGAQSKIYKPAKKAVRPARVRAKAMLKRSKRKAAVQSKVMRPKIYAAPGMREGTGVFTRHKKVSDALTARAKYRKGK